MTFLIIIDLVLITNNRTRRDQRLRRREDTVKCLIRSVQGVYLSASAKNNNIESCFLYVQIGTLASRSRAGRGGNRDTEGSRRFGHTNIPTNSSKETQEWTSEQIEGSRIHRNNNTEWRPSFFSSFHQQVNKINGIYIYIYISKVQYGTKI